MFETLGVQATQEVQAAGRKVARENALLRVLLRLHGVSDRDIQKYLTAHARNIVPFTAHSETLLEASPCSREEKSGNAVSRGSPQPSLLNKRSDPLHENETVTPEATSSLSSLDANRQAAISDSQFSDTGRPVPVEPPINNPLKLQPSSRNQDSGQSTPCETAARIITSMQSYPDAREVRSELGCRSSSNCMVRNMDIFQLLDQ